MAGPYRLWPAAGDLPFAQLYGWPAAGYYRKRPGGRGDGISDFHQNHLAAQLSGAGFFCYFPSKIATSISTPGSMLTEVICFNVFFDEITSITLL